MTSIDFGLHIYTSISFGTILYLLCVCFNKIDSLCFERFPVTAIRLALIVGVEMVDATVTI